MFFGNGLIEAGKNPNRMMSISRKDAKAPREERTFFRDLRSLNFASLRLCGNKSGSEKDLAKRAMDAKFGE